jgi:hypothetical protein
MHGYIRLYPSPAWCLKASACIALLLLAACGRDSGPRREEVNGVEHVYNRAHPLEGAPLPQPQEAQSLLLLQEGSEEVPAWSAVRDVRAVPGGGMAVIDMHRTEVNWFDRQGNTVVSMDLSRPPMRLTSPVAAAFFEDGGGVSIDMALRRAVAFDSEGMLLYAFDFNGGLPMDMDLGTEGDLYILTCSRPFIGGEQVWQVRRYDMAGSPMSIAGSDSLYLGKSPAEGTPYTLLTSLSVGPDGTLYASGLDYTIHQVLPDGKRRVITRPTIESRVPDYVLEQRRRLMQRRIRSQQLEVPITEEVTIVQLLALDDGGVLVQTNEWHPTLLDEAINSQVNILLLDRFSKDGTFIRRYAVELSLPRTEIHLTDAGDGFIYGYAVPSAGEGPTTAFSFSLPEE